MTDNQQGSEQTAAPSAGKLVPIGIILAVLGLLVSLYATNHHIEVKMTGSSDAACNINETFSCDDIAKSEYSELFGTPIAVFGAAYFLGLLLLLGVGQAKPEYRKDNMITYGVMVAIGVVVSLVFGSISMVSIGKMCVTCIAVYIVTFIQMGVVFAFKGEIEGPFSTKALSKRHFDG